MAALNSWQKITRVIPGRPFGEGSDGALSSATVPSITRQSCSGAAAQGNLTIASGAFTNGDLVLIHQSRGTGAGQWEINKVSSGGGTTTLTMQEDLQYTYTDSGASQAQVMKIPQYTDITVESGTWSPTDWGGDTGGLFAIACKEIYTQTGSVEINGGGFRGGARQQDPAVGDNGEGASAQPGSAASGAGEAGGGTAPGGGYGTAGTKGEGTNGTVGAAYGNTDLLLVTFGGGGAGAHANPITAAGNGAAAGGAIIIFAKTVVTPTGTMSVNGSNGSAGGDRGGGAGSGGAILIVCQTAALGTDKFTAAGGTGGVGTTGQDGGNGGVGIIAIHHSGDVTGTTSPTFNDTEDTSLVETDIGGGNPIFFSSGALSVG